MPQPGSKNPPSRRACKAQSQPVSGLKGETLPACAPAHLRAPLSCIPRLNTQSWFAKLSKGYLFAHANTCFQHGLTLKSFVGAGQLLTFIVIYRDGKAAAKLSRQRKSLLIFQTEGLSLLVGVAGFELATPCTPCKCATRLRYTPNPQILSRFSHPLFKTLRIF